MNKENIIAEIRRTAKANGGVPLGWKRFESETGIKHNDWFGKFWACWSDAVREAGFEPNRLNEAYDDETLLRKLVELTHRLLQPRFLLKTPLRRPSTPSRQATSLFT